MNDLSKRLEEFVEASRKVRNSMDNLAQDLDLLAEELKKDYEQPTK